MPALTEPVLGNGVLDREQVGVPLRYRKRRFDTAGELPRTIAVEFIMHPFTVPS